MLQFYNPRLEEPARSWALYSRGNFWDASARARAQVNTLNALCIANNSQSYRGMRLEYTNSMPVEQLAKEDVGRETSGTVKTQLNQDVQKITISQRH